MRILAVPHAIALAHVTRTLEVAKALRARGHEIIFACANGFESFITQANFECRAITTEPPARALARVREGKRFRDDERMLESYVQAELGLFRAVRPDLVLGDFRPTLSISSEMAGLPYAAITNGCFSKYYSAQHPPPQTWPITHILGRHLSPMVVPFLQRLALKFMARPIRRYRARRGLRPVETLLDVFESPDLNLIADIPEFAPMSRLPDNFAYIGPILWEPAAAMPDWWETLADRRIIYVTLGSTGETGGVLDMILTAVSSLDAEIVVAAKGIAPDRWPKNVHAMPLAPGRLIASRAALTICHGGNGTIYQSLSVGCPVLSLPTFIEQEIHADRVADLGAGRKIAPRFLSIDSIRRACDDITSGPSYRARAMELSKRIADFNAPVEAATVIERRFHTQKPLCA